jgi:hypothetical protein
MRRLQKGVQTFDKIKTTRSPNAPRQKRSFEKEHFVPKVDLPKFCETKRQPEHSEDCGRERTSVRFVPEKFLVSRVER